MKICILTSAHPPLDVRIFYKEARSLAKAGHQVILLTRADFLEKIIDGVQIKGVGRTKTRLRRILHALVFLRLAYNEEADVYHFHDPELLLVGLILKWWTGKKVIYDSHENFPEVIYAREWAPKLLRPLVAYLVNRLELLIARCLDVVITVTPDQTQRFCQAHCTTQQIRNYPLRSNIPQELPPWTERKQQVIYVGSLTTVRGLFQMLEMMEILRPKFPELTLLLVGSFHDASVKQEFFQRVGKKRLNASVVWKNYVPHPEVFPYLCESKIGLIPFQKNPKMIKMVDPTKLLEYMVCGLPVVTSDLLSLRYFINRTKGGLLVEPDNAEEMAKAVQQLLENPQWATQMAEEGRRAVLQRYSWRQEEEKLLRLYSKL